jgi:hypothetical protein
MPRMRGFSTGHVLNASFQPDHPKSKAKYRTPSPPLQCTLEVADMVSLLLSKNYLLWSLPNSDLLHSISFRDRIESDKGRQLREVLDFAEFLSWQEFLDSV